MSEFSDSLHFVGFNEDRAAERARAAGVACVVLGCNENTASVLVRDADVLAISSQGRVIRYQFGSDHGLWLSYIVSGKTVAKLELVWDESTVVPGEGTRHHARVANRTCGEWVSRTKQSGTLTQDGK